MISGWITLFAFTFLCSVAIKEGKYAYFIKWITNKEKWSGTNHWVTFQFLDKDGVKSKTYWPNKYFWRGRYSTAYLNGPSIGYIDKVIVGVVRRKGTLHQDDWNGWVVDITDLNTKKVFEISPSWIDTNKTKVFKAKEVACRDRPTIPKNSCRNTRRVYSSGCGTSSSASGAFNMARGDHYLCLKTCKFCVP